MLFKPIFNFYFCKDTKFLNDNEKKQTKKNWKKNLDFLDVPFMFLSFKKNP